MFSQNIAQINRNAPGAKIEAMEAVIGGCPRAIQKKEVYNQMHLPEGTLQAWKTHIIPAWRDFASAQENPWHTVVRRFEGDLGHCISHSSSSGHRHGWPNLQCCTSLSPVSDLMFR